MAQLVAICKVHPFFHYCRETLTEGGSTASCSSAEGDIRCAVYETAGACIPVTEVEEAAVVVQVLILEAQVGPAAQTVVSYAQLLGHGGLSGFPPWEAKRPK